jgi:hypothetical protein
MPRMSRIGRSLFLLGAALLLLGPHAPVAAQQGPPVNAGKPSDKQLHAPADPGESFDFMIFGDRTGGPPEGIEVLKQGVDMANRMDVDLVMTVGDLVEGYNKPEQWLPQMREFKGVMDGLDMPWYPVAGNHDVYARPQRPGGNMALYSEYFGPLYYSFDYKWAHFIALFSDEALSFGNPPKDQNFSPEQIEWLRKDLAATKARQIYVFLHHPRWTQRYNGCNWYDVHRMFVSDGRPVTVFAGHIHLYRCDGQIDNVRYYTLATTGGHKGRYQQTAALHHVDFVRVRPDRITVAVLPVGSVLADDFVLGREVDAMDELSRGDWCVVDGTLSITLDEGRRSSFTVRLANRADRAMRMSAEVKASYGWTLDWEPIDQELAPGESLTAEVKATAPGLGDAEPHASLHAVAYYPLKSGLIEPITIQQNLPIEARLPADAGAADADNNGVLVLDGSSAVRVEVPEQLAQYTLECWVRGSEPKGSTALVTKTEASAFGIFWCDESEGCKLPTGYVGTRAGYLSLSAKKGWEWGQWTHLALVFDGKKATLYVNGQLQAEETTGATPTHNRHPLYVGADPNGRGKPTRFFTGMIDEVRLSSVARYDTPFRPRPVFERDDHTVFLFHFDRSIGGVFPDDSGTSHHGWASGKPKIERASR